MKRRDITDEEIIASTHGFFTRYAWYKVHSDLYHLALRRGLLAQLWTILKPGAGPQKAFSEAELFEDAKKYETRINWREAGEAEKIAGGFSHYGSALKYSSGFMRQCCAHMPDMRGKYTPVQYSEADIEASARKFKHRNDWKVAEPHFYQAAHRRGLVDKVSSHMVPQAHPYSGHNIVYAYEFDDQYAYIGQTFQPRIRHTMHMIRGVVYDHLQVCPEHSYRVLESGLTSLSVGEAECRWQAHYEAQGWKPLWTAKGGGLGTIQVTKWTKEAVLAEALKYATKQAWIDGSQMSYRIAKREGWFEAASAHMPRRVLGVGVGREVSASTRQKQREAKLGKAQTAAQCKSRSEAIKIWWISRRVQI